MKKTFFAMFAVAAFLLGMTGCSKDDNSSTVDISALEKSLVGLWWDEFEYSDVTEDGTPFSHVLLAVDVDADHSGCIYLALFNKTDEEPLAIYGGPDDAGFKWKLLENGDVVISDPTTGESAVLARTRADNSNYGNDMTNVANTNMNFANGSITMNNGTYSGTLNKANDDQKADIEERLRERILSNVNLGLGGKTPSDFGEDDIR
jgi:hypothetical protein